MKITDEAQSKLLAYCDIAQKDLDENDLTEEGIVCSLVGILLT